MPKNSVVRSTDGNPYWPWALAILYNIFLHTTCSIGFAKIQLNSVIYGHNSRQCHKVCEAQYNVYLAGNGYSMIMLQRSERLMGMIIHEPPRGKTNNVVSEQV